ncbi:MAG: biotin/lipoyl-binding protein [Nostoc sp.]|uniref:biotin/lipoyl-binding protein n=1 Tax=Nostoc sp. TaxID=1180 RepID=UPI002FF2E379
MLKRNYLLKYLSLLLANPALVIVLMLTGLTSGCQKNDPPANAQSPPPLPVKLQKIDAGTIEESSEFVGSLEAQKKVTLQPQIQGRIESILVSSGQRVQQGTPIASLSLDQAQARLLTLWVFRRFLFMQFLCR